LLLLAGTPTGNKVKFKRGQVITILDYTGGDNATYSPLIGFYLVIEGTDVSFLREAKYDRFQSWNQQSLSLVSSPGSLNGDGTLLIDRSGNYVEVTFGSSGADVRYLQDITSLV